MKIRSIETSVIALPCDMGGPPPLFAGKPWTHLEMLLVRVETEDGLIGWGEAFGHTSIPATRAALETIVAPMVIGRDSTDIHALTREVLHAVHLLGRNGPFVFAYSGIEIALWDLLGKRTGQALHTLLGGSRHTEVPAYASLLNYDTEELVARNTSAACAAGYRHVKLHQVTRNDTLAAINAPGAKDARIMLDVNCAWSVPVALDKIDSLKNDGLMWIEEPVWPPEDCQGLAQVRKRGIPVSAGENVAGVFGFKSLIEAGAIDIAQPSVSKIGGIGEVLRVIDLCDTHGIDVALHSPYFGPGFIATIHLAAARVERPLVEVLWLEMEANPFDPWVTTTNGHLKVPQGPGLGVEPDPEILARYTVGKATRITEATQA